MVTFDTSTDAFAVDSVVFRRVIRVIESDFAPLVVDAVGGQLDLRRLFLAFLRYLVLGSPAERRAADH